MPRRAVDRGDRLIDTNQAVAVHRLLRGSYEVLAEGRVVQVPHCKLQPGLFRSDILERGKERPAIGGVHDERVFERKAGEVRYELQHVA
jgi:hypothetical protein